jgi:hypothetical protein
MLYGVFQQDSATAHRTYTSLEALCEVSYVCIIKFGLWPQLSPDLTTCDTYFWVSLKDKGSRSSSVSIVSDYGLDDRAIGVRSPAGAKDISSNLCI